MNITEVVISLLATASMIAGMGGPSSVVKEVSLVTAEVCADAEVADAVRDEFGKYGEELFPTLRNSCFELR